MKPRKLEIGDAANRPSGMELDLGGKKLLDARTLGWAATPPPRFAVWRPCPGAGENAGFWEGRWDLADGDVFLEICDLPAPEFCTDEEQAMTPSVLEYLRTLPKPSAGSAE